MKTAGWPGAGGPGQREGPGAREEARPTGRDRATHGETFPKQKTHTHTKTQKTKKEKNITSKFKKKKRTKYKRNKDVKQQALRENINEGRQTNFKTKQEGLKN